MNCYEDFKKRGLIETESHEEIKDALNNKSISFYCGYDPTAKSLQIGNLFAVITMMRLQKYGHKPYVLVGGATGMIGDPSGKNAERNLLNEETLQANINGQKAQLENLLDFNCGENSAVVVNNYDWMSGFTFLNFLRDVGKRFRLSEMLAKDSVKSRLNSEAGISFTEFAYQMLQAYDFSYLNEKFGVSMQIGGGDQWGNITAGIDLTRKLHSNQVFGMTIPLVTDSQGKKFGKSEGGATIYLDPQMTSPYKMYQYLINTDDSCVEKYLNYFTFLSHEEIESIVQESNETPHLRIGQKKIAEAVTELVHGKEGLDSAKRATQFFFGEKIENVSDADVASIFEDIPSVTLSASILEGGLVIDMLSETPLFKSKKEVRRSVEQKGVYINNVAVASSEQTLSKSDLASETSMVLRKGKKNYCVVTFS
ncbi:tyrosine--tRNA ligase [Halobacteriovorax sp. HLS]|uniref:tyrosine--tRNA ligase n=1 Tax=Halobacteriovorax sp. HLS TaxID=2234000 RepID=UPI000FD6FD61|nr:tyrosine--tRNA ligase [Halobacteriovorax sp. HLS]